MGQSEDKIKEFIFNPSKETLIDIFQSNLGEQNNLEFKQEWVDCKKIVRHMLAMANSKGGCIILGVQETPTGYAYAGLPKKTDPVDMHQQLARFIPEALNYKVYEFLLQDSKMFQAIIIYDQPEHIPFMPMSSSDDIQKTDIFIRRGTASIRANFEELSKILDRRIQNGISSSTSLSLNEHIEQLKELYKTEKINLKHPDIEEDFDRFIVRCVIMKKSKIENILKA